MPNLFQFLVLFLTGILDLLIAIIIWRRRGVPGAISMALMMLAVGGWTFVTAGEMASISVASKILWSKTSYLFIASIAPLWLLFSLQYTYNDRWITRLRVSLLWVIPLAVMILAATNEFHHLIWPSVTPSSPVPGASLIYGHGPAVWVITAYSYILILTGAIALLNVTLRSQAIFRVQTLAVIGATLIPWAGNFLYMVRRFTIAGLDSTPFAFAISGLLLLISFKRYRFFSLAPIASHTLFENVNSGIIVLDLQDHIVETNPTAQRFLKLGPSAIGKRLDSFSPPVFERLASMRGDQSPLELLTEFEGESRWLHVAVSTLRHRNMEMGKLFVIQDISDRKRLEKEREEMIESLEKALAEIKTLRGFIPICSHCKKIRTDEGFWQQIENYIGEHSDVIFSHGICPECMDKYYSFMKKKQEPSSSNGTG